jgi:hypothetical protein
MATPGPLPAHAEAPPRWPTPVPAAATGVVALNPNAVLGQGVASERRCRRPRKRRASARGQRDLLLEHVWRTDSDQDSQPPASRVHASIPCCLDWTNQMTRAEDDLANAVVVSVISDRPAVDPQEIAALIAPRLDVETASLVLRQVSPSSFLLVLPSQEMIPALTEQRPLLRTTSFSIACKRWSRFSGSSGGLLPCLVDFQLQGIPVHAWPRCETWTKFLGAEISGLWSPRRSRMKLRWGRKLSSTPSPFVPQ